MKFAVKYLVKRALVRTITHLFCNFFACNLNADATVRFCAVGYEFVKE